MKTNVLVDSSVWVAHFRQSNRILSELLLADAVVCHPMIIAELACGTPPSPRLQTLASLHTLRQTKQATLNEVHEFIERESLYGLGCRLVDICLLASTLIIPNTVLWTSDKALAALATRFDIAFIKAVH